MNLNTFVRHAVDHLAAVIFCDGSFSGVADSLVFQMAGAVDKKTPGFAFNDHVSDHLLDKLKAGNRLAKLDPLLGIFLTDIDATLGCSDTTCRYSVAPEIKCAQGKLKTFIYL